MLFIEQIQAHKDISLSKYSRAARKEMSLRKNTQHSSFTYTLSQFRFSRAFNGRAVPFNTPSGIPLRNRLPESFLLSGFTFRVFRISLSPVSALTFLSSRRSIRVMRHPNLHLHIYPRAFVSDDGARFLMRASS